MLRKGVEVVPLFFDNDLPTQDAKERAFAVVRKLGFRKVWVAPHGRNHEAFAERCDARLACVFCKRMMLRIASALARRLGADALVMGDSLAQVASQTAQNLYVVSQAAGVPVIRPLIGLDKEETIALAKELGTYDVSIMPAICCVRAPDRPATAARLGAMLAEEAKLDIDALVTASLEGAKEVVL